MISEKETQVITYINAVSSTLSIILGLIGVFCIYVALNQKLEHKGKATGTKIFIGNFFLALSATVLNPKIFWVIPSLFWVSGIINILFVIKHIFSIWRINREMSLDDSQIISLMNERREVNKKIRKAIELAGFTVYTGFLLRITIEIIF